MQLYTSLRWMKLYWRYILIFVVPIIFSFIPILVPNTAARCGYVILVMAVYWMTEALPMAVTSLIPVFAFPMLGILSTADCCLVYMKQTNMMFLGGLMVAIAIEHCNLHKRIALFVILHVGQSPRRLMAGFMMTTMFLSMWISNTATTAMMVPIVNAILAELYPSETKNDEEKETTINDAIENNPDKNEMEMVPKGVENNAYITETPGLTEKDLSTDVKVDVIHTEEEVIDDKNNDNAEEEEEEEEEEEKLTEKDMMGRALFLGVAYSANTGGTGVVTGTAPNLVMMAILASNFSEPTGLNFATWIAFNLPGMLICVFLAWLWLQFLFMGLCRKNSGIQQSTPEREAAVKRLISTKYKELGSMTQHEITVLILFLVLVSLWLFRDPEFIPGWASVFTHDLRIGDATPAMMIVFLLFALPSRFESPFSKDPTGKARRSAPQPCMSWQAIHEKVPWNVVLLLGGGFAIAKAAQTSGLSAWLGLQFEALQVLPKEAIVLVVCLMTAMLTEVASNTATASVLLPVLKDMALNINVNPLYLMLPAAVCCSYAFMLPVATAPNAIVFSVANMKSTDMMKAGFVMNILCVLVITVMINTLGVAMFDLHSMPAWANSTVT